MKDPKYNDLWEVFKIVFRHFYEEGAKFLWIDEVSFNTRHIHPYTWVSKDNPTPIQNYQPAYLTAICALTDQGEIFSKMWVGTNTGDCMIEFLEELETVNRSKYCGVTEDGKFRYLEYWWNLVYIFDNASIHTD